MKEINGGGILGNNDSASSGGLGGALNTSAICYHSSKPHKMEMSPAVPRSH